MEDSPIFALKRIERQKDILIVDDSAMNLFVLENLLKIKLGRECHRVNSGMEAISFCQEYFEYNMELMPRLLILMDVNMPEVSGIEATKIIRESLRGTNSDQEIKNNLKIFALSAQEEGSIAESFIFDHFVSKPVDVATLEELLSHYGF